MASVFLLGSLEKTTTNRNEHGAPSKKTRVRGCVASTPSSTELPVPDAQSILPQLVLIRSQPSLPCSRNLHPSHPRVLFPLSFETFIFTIFSINNCTMLSPRPAPCGSAASH